MGQTNAFTLWCPGRCAQGQVLCVPCPSLWPALDLFSLCLLCHLQVFHYSSFAILTLFMMEVFLKLFVFRLEFFHHKFEILDTFVVVVSFILDLVLLFQKHEFEALGLLILLRLWRVARIINGMAPARGSHRGSAGWVEPGSRPPGPGSISSWLVFSREKIK